MTQTDQNNLEKARSGIYRNTPENKSLGRVGARYGSKNEDDFYNKQVNLHGKYKDFIEGFAEEVGAYALVSPPKGSKRLKEKIATDYNGDFSQVRDILRSTLIVDRDKLESTIGTILKKFDQANSKFFSFKAHVDFTSTSYQGANFVIEFEGFAVEIQVNTPVNLAMKDNSFRGHPALKNTYEILEEAGVEAGAGHAMYEKQRSSSNKEEKMELENQMIEYYKNRYRFLLEDKIIMTKAQAMQILGI